MTTALLETLTSTELPLAQHSELIGAVLEGQEGASATVKVNGVAATYPVTLTESDTLRIERPVGEVVTRLYGQPGPNAGTGPKGDIGPMGPAGPTGPQGVKGDPGPAGTAATVTVGTVTTGAAGTQAKVTNSGTTSAAVLNFIIPKGADGTGGSGAVSSVAGRTGDVTLTKADVGLSNVTNDAQVKRSEMGVASGVATLGADGKVPATQLPAGTGGTMDAETVQDIVGAMVRAGSNTTVTYDDTANTLTVSATGSGGGGPAYLSSGSATLDTPPATLSGDTLTGPFYSGSSIIWRFEAMSDITFSALRFSARGAYADATYHMKVYASDGGWTQGALLGGTGVLLNAEKNVTAEVRALLDTITLTAGERFLVQLQATAGQPLVVGSSVAVSLPLSYAAGRVRYAGSAAVNDDASENGGAVPLLTFEAQVVKTALGPLDPADFPISTTAAAPNKSGFMVVDDAAKTASLYWKFSDGSTKKLDLT